MNVRIRSDFREYYDHAFDLSGMEWFRNSEDDLSRSSAHNRMRNMGLNVPRSGLLNNRKLLREMGNIQVVVYTNEYTHRGEGKLLLQLEEAMVDYPGCYASAYIHRPVAYSQPSSVRRLRIGSSIHWLEYWSEDTWRSNYSTVDAPVDIYTYVPGITANIIDYEPYPMLAIDFVESIYGAWYAIDYNTSPGIGGTPIEGILTPNDIYKEVANWMDERYDEYHTNVEHLREIREE